MDEILSSIMVILVLGVVGGGIFLLARRRQAASEQELVRMARERGWTLETIREPLMWGLRITGGGWMLEALSRSSGTEAGPGSSNVAMSTFWKADLPGNTLMIGGRGPGPSLRDSIIRQFVRTVTGEDLADVAFRDSSLQAKYMFRAEDPAEAREWLSVAAEQALLAWKKTAPVIRRDRSGLQMEVTGQRLKDPTDLLAFIQLGETLLKAED